MKRLINALLIILANAFAYSASAQKDTLDVVIVGGGFSGLTSAYYLNHLDILVLEKEKEAGGRCLTGEWNGFHYPKGTEYMGKPEGLQKKLFRDLDVKAKEIPGPADGIAINNRIYYGDRLLDFLSEQELKDYDRLREELSKLNDLGVEDHIFYDEMTTEDLPLRLDAFTVSHWLQSGQYPDVLTNYVNVENRGLFGTDNSSHSMYFDIPEMAYDLPLPGDKRSEVYSFDNGMYSIIEGFANKLGDRLQTGMSVKSVKVLNNGLSEVRYVSEDGEHYSALAKAVIMSTPSQITAELVDGHFSQHVKSSLRQIDYSQYVTINFFLKERYLKDAWSIACLEEGDVVTFYDVIRPQVDNDYNGPSILSVYMAPKHAKDTTFIGLSDENLLNKAKNSLEKYFSGINKSIAGHDITRFKYAFPVFSPMYGKRLDILKNDATTFGPLFLAGDYMVYATVDGAMISGQRAAKRTLEYLKP
ncbi:protoporphyrinogen/coproporphyrinogen oxidase [Aureibacter tunicatorum]|uniref:Protoporphyrinogen oxidase n=1 Tax=Aureibacter tunicatorum TaxID=866807 RepID=A0AAE3XKB2_9BACT|nr:FAD-dependent oxidoreductase [Aureibacter tunicatorum]MDR6237563.1 protoporphyrinogen oxidase [Aureibacter tunicatorum]BDD02597.1 hypothetical protein AUTU_00800 [Aureibacter tunicatorum]